MKNTSNTIRTICEVGIFAALGFVFDELQGIISKGVFVNGGSIGFAMIAVLIIAYRRGFFPAFLTGLLMGLIDICTSAYILNFGQLCLDYILPYAFVAVAGLFKPLFDKADGKMKVLWLVVGAVVGGIAKFFSHYFAGILFWADPAGFAWNLKDMNPFLYCFVYNIAFIGPSIVLCAILLVILYTTAPKILTNKNVNDADETKTPRALHFISSSLVTAGGLFVFIFYLIKYLKSYYGYNDGSAFGYDFDPDYGLIMVLGLFITVLGVICLVKSFRGKFSFKFLTLGLTCISVASIVYATARLLRMIVKHKAYSTYLVWFYVGLIILAIFASLYAGFASDKENTKAIEE